MTDTLATDIAVIGAGTAGLTAFHEITRAGRSAVLIDRGPLGTTCARVGCMPSKAVLHASHQAATLRALAPGGLPRATADELWRQAIATRDALAKGAADRTVRAAGDRLLMGAARFLEPGLLEVGGRRVRARAFVIATGSSPVVPRPLAALGERVLTSDSLFELDALPRSIGIVGAGAIGLEMAVALHRLGVRVVAGDLQATPAGVGDPVVAERVRAHFGRELPLWLGRPITVEAAAQGLRFSDGERSDVVDVVLAAVGRRPNVADLGLQQAGIALDEHGAPVLDGATLRAGDSSLFFAGDVQPERPLMHEAADEGVIAARGALALVDGAAAAPPRRRTPLAIVFSDPDIASVGQAFGQLDPAGFVVGSAEGSGNGRSKILAAPDNLLRVYAERGSGRLLGASLMATHGEHLAHLLAWAVQRGETAAGLLEMPYYHPSIEEMLQSALKDAAGQLKDTP